MQIYALVYFVDLSRYILKQSDDCHNDHVAMVSGGSGLKQPDLFHYTGQMKFKHGWLLPRQGGLSG